MIIIKKLTQAYYFLVLTFLLSIEVGSKKHIYKTHKQVNQITLKGQIITPALLDLGIMLPLNIKVYETHYNLQTEISGQFLVNVTVKDQFSKISGVIEANFQDQFNQYFYFDAQVQNIVNIGRFVLNNNQTQKTLISGKVVDSYSGQAINEAQITLNFKNPINLGVFTSITSMNGTFSSSNIVMRLLLYGVQIKVQAKDYEDWDQDGIILYNTYEFDINNISLTLRKIQAFLKVRVVKNQVPQNQQIVSAICIGQKGRYFQAQPNITNHDGIVILNSYINQQELDQDYFCTIWTNNTYEQITLTNLIWDGTNNKTLYLNV